MGILQQVVASQKIKFERIDIQIVVGCLLFLFKWKLPEEMCQTFRS